MATKHRRLRPAAYAVINAAVFAVCAVIFYQIGKHHAAKPEVDAEQSTESSFAQENSADTMVSQPTEEQTAGTETSPADSDARENQWHYGDVPWASAYQQLLWSGEYQSEFQKNAIFYHENGRALDDHDYYRNMDADINIYASLIYLDEDDIPELALTSAYHTMIYTYADDKPALVMSLNTLNAMHYYPRKMWLGDHFFRTMGGISYVDIYDFSAQGLKSGTEQHVRFDYAEDGAEEYFLEPAGIEYSFGGEWRELREGGCLVSSFSPNDVISELYRALEE